MFPIIRIVDPEKKKVLECIDGKPVMKNQDCYTFWKRGVVCKNCVSMRALDTKEIVVKVEQHSESVYWVTAIPMKTDQGPVVIELLRQVTDNMVLGDQYQGKLTDFCQLVDNINLLVVRDALTGVYNRYYIEERLPAELKYGQEKGVAISVIMVDLDKFKDINDKYGHVVGDEVLRNAAHILQGAIRREEDWVARYGGEEFLICLLGSDAGSARMVAERMCDAIAKQDMGTKDIGVHVTASFGVCTIGVNAMDMCTAIDCADKRLYRAKEAGGNLVVAG